VTRKERPLRIACSGLAAVEYGSVSSAGYEVLKELLRRKHEIDFFSSSSYVYPQFLIEGEGLNYFDCSQRGIDAVITRLGSGRLSMIAAKLVHRKWTRGIVRAMRRRHVERPYDVELFLGQWAFGRVARVPVISWVQGPPGTDARSIRRHRRDIARLCGLREYALLRAYAWYKGSRLGLPAFEHSDICICGSRMSAQVLVDTYGLRAERVHALPYPIDLAAFAPQRPPRSPGAPLELLWLGRVVPRKRLDLFLDAGALLIENGWDVTLTVVGGFAFARGYEQLLESFAYPERLTYVAQMPREEVSICLQSAAVLVQPSEEENFGSSVAEALACGTPVVVGPTNGTGDYMGGGGRRCRAYTPHALAAALTRVLSDTDREPSLHAVARQAAVDHLGVERVVDGLEAIMHSATLPRDGEAGLRS
jgi:glycosyltransferase involved in cell wall biosynthesis